MKRAFLVVALAGVAVTFATAVAAAASPGPTLTEAKQSRFPNRSYVLTLPEKRLLTSGQVEVLENGQPVDSVTVTAAGAGPQAGFATVLVIDASNSMAGTPIKEAIAAAKAFAVRRNARSALGVVMFNRQTAILVTPTTDAVAIENALGRTVKLQEGTRIYDALDVARRQLAASRAVARTIVLLSDGDDVGSTATPSQALELLKQDKVRVFTVGLRSKAFSSTPLRELASETGGQYAEAQSASQLSPLFEALGYKLANEYLLLYRSLEKPDRSVTVSVSVAGFPTATTSTYRTPSLESLSRPFERSLSDRVLQSVLSLFVVVMLVVGLMIYGIRAILRAQEGTLRRRMAQFVSMPSDVAARERRAEISALLSDRASRTFKDRRWLEGFAEDCELAEVKPAPATLVFWSLAGALLLGAVLSVAAGSVLAFPLGFVVPLIVRAYVKRKVARKRKAFGEQLPDNLEVLASALRAGHSLVGALSVVAEDAPEPSRSELRRIIADEQLGAPLDDALEVCVRRMANRDLDQVALVALLQREAGGNAAEVIDQVADNIRARMELRRLVQTLTAQGRMARWIVTLLPVALFFAILLLNGDYLEPLWTTGFGIFAAVTAAIMVVLGSLSIKKIVNIKI